MQESEKKNSRQKERDLSSAIEAKAARKLAASKESAHVVWFGLGMMGLIGWSIVIPTLIGTAIGLWLDEKYRGSHHWTLALLVAGLSLGCLNAWYWVVKTEREIPRQPERKND
jgi:ATP synthase protein I